MPYLISPKLHFSHTDRGKLLEDEPRPRWEFCPRFVIDDTEAAKVVSIGSSKRSSCVKPDFRAANHLRVVDESPIQVSVQHDKGLIRADCF